MISRHDIAHMADIIADRHGDWFSAHLLRLIKKADPENRNLLRLGFPTEVKIVELWENRKSDEAWAEAVHNGEV